MTTGAERYRVTFVCTGNLCRSPIAEAVVRAAVEHEGLADRVEVDSAGTDPWSVMGDPADSRAVALLERHGYDASTHVARVLDRSAIRRTDLVVAMARNHEEVLRGWAGEDDDPGRIRLMRSFDPGAVAKDKLDVLDPFYGKKKDFERVLRQVEAAVPGLVAHVRDGLAVKERTAQERTAQERERPA
ncbi:low molecular weight protein-tyrosine-phosphatase [Quadrisphaera sp. DSM 44207]|uniref:low molecular weight protein-tyrosine-phosphatase n=1 Tax=Quadrisphaera sp. DSM 44207 TaxID=1881057 RepID=UPI00087FE362|nr:low molecular weight protein-tyrosine-phosphatase [Quadrisphaera sp. DSM 44207]SDQ89104.1 protein tyrosine phosphatase [Quadrisphaera sp. DSM 44207]